MCEILSGHIVIERGKDWGKILLLSGIHHEKDREEIYKTNKLKLCAWQTKKYASFKDGFDLTISEGDVTEKEKTELIGLLTDWATKQDMKKIFLEKFLTVSENGKRTDDFTLDLENKVFSCMRVGISVDAREVKGFGWQAGNGSTLKAGYGSTLTAGDESTLTGGDWSTLKAGYGSTLTAGDESTLTAGVESTLTAGVESTLTAGDESTLTGGDWSTLTAGVESTLTAGYGSTLKAGYGSTQIIYGDTCYIILDGKDVILRQIWWEDEKYQSAIVDHNKLFKEYKKGDKIKIVKGKVMKG